MDLTRNTINLVVYLYIECTDGCSFLDYICLNHLQLIVEEHLGSVVAMLTYGTVYFPTI